MRSYGNLVMDAQSGIWGIWCTAGDGFYISYSSMENMYQDIKEVVLGEVQRIENEVS